MKFSHNIIIQILALIAQLLNALTAIVPEDKKIYIGLGLVLVQGIAGILAHQSNPDGTPATTAYRKE